ncbi:hypothetical protein BS50DRAFT_589380 [Corynespora cassiicola Philippines]|uniref:RRM domain-containing protein n=1 Tax=Corynespora cassiicola Philippines TaxID=1448308 RepID=A0A2T2NHK4_CORCC|nr:hypothetical protein BS50DRAFT_589380 [Corynespora cassiicola Philippines]
MGGPAVQRNPISAYTFDSTPSNTTLRSNASTLPPLWPDDEAAKREITAFLQALEISKKGTTPINLFPSSSSVDSPTEQIPPLSTPTAPPSPKPSSNGTVTRVIRPENFAHLTASSGHYGDSEYVEDMRRQDALEEERRLPRRVVVGNIAVGAEEEDVSVLFDKFYYQMAMTLLAQKVLMCLSSQEIRFVGERHPVHETRTAYLEMVSRGWAKKAVFHRGQIFGLRVHVRLAVEEE